MKIDAQDIIRGDQLAGARLIRQLEEGDPAGIDILKSLYPHTGTAFVMGVTGPPGSGKSTLVNSIISEVRQRNMKIAVVAIDPSSPISGGALLGDRIRMRRHTEDDGVFIRSMATRGHHDVLTTLRREPVGDGRGVGRVGKPRPPDLFARVLVEGTQEAVGGGADEDEAPGSCDRPAQVRGSEVEPEREGCLIPRGSESRFPQDPSRDQVHGAERAPGWRGAGDAER